LIVFPPLRSLVAGILGVAILLASPAARAQMAPEYEVKAGFLYNFAKFVTWPPNVFDDPNSPIIIGILGADPFGEGIGDVLAGETAQGRPIRVREIARIDDGRPECHVLFVSQSERRNLPRILRILAATPVLTVGDNDDFAALGGIIQFFLDQGRVRFIINVAASRRAGLKISSQLLRLARVMPE
jgi:hypothetical protein